MSAVESEHQRLTKQMNQLTWESGYWRGSHQRLRVAVDAAINLIETGSDAAMIRRFLIEVATMDDQITAQSKLKDAAPEYPPDHPAPGDLGSVPL